MTAGRAGRLQDADMAAGCAPRPAEPSLTLSRLCAGRGEGRGRWLREADEVTGSGSGARRSWVVLRSALQDAGVPALVPRPLRLDRARPRVLPRLLRLVPPRSPPPGHRSDDPGGSPRRARRSTPRRPRARPGRRLHRDPRTLRQTTAAAARATDRRLDQQARRRTVRCSRIFSTTPSSSGLTGSAGPSAPGGRDAARPSRCQRASGMPVTKSYQ